MKKLLLVLGMALIVTLAFAGCEVNINSTGNKAEAPADEIQISSSQGVTENSSAEEETASHVNSLESSAAQESQISEVTSVKEEVAENNEYEEAANTSAVSEVISEPVVGEQSNEVSSKAASSKESQAQSSSSAVTETYISKNKAKQIALNHAGVKERELRELEMEFETENGISKWEIDFEVGLNDYEYSISAETGKIIKSEKNEKITSSSEAESSSPVLKTKAQAEKTALNHAGVKANAVREFEAELDSDGAVPKWEIEFKSGGYEYSYEINAETGKIINSEKELDD